MYRIKDTADFSFLVDQELTQICIGPFDLQLNFRDGISISIYVDNAQKSFRHHATTQPQSDPSATFPLAAQTLLSLIGKRTTSVTVNSPTCLTVAFDNDEFLEIYDSSDVYESFTITGGPQGVFIV